MTFTTGVQSSLTPEEEQLARWFFDNIFASIRYVHHQGFDLAADTLVKTGFIERHGDLYVLASQKKTELTK
jgi:hypothetical protein